MHCCSVNFCEGDEQMHKLIVFFSRIRTNEYKLYSTAYYTSMNTKVPELVYNTKAGGSLTIDNVDLKPYFVRQIIINIKLMPKI